MFIRTMRFVAVLAITLALVPGRPTVASAADPDDVYYQFIDVMGIDENLQPIVSAVNQHLLPIIKQANPGLSDETLKIVMTEFENLIIEEVPVLEAGWVEIYKQAFTPDEVRELIEFYRTPVGAKSVRVIPVIFQQGMQLGQAWAQQAVPKVVERLKAKMQDQGIDIQI